MGGKRLTIISREELRATIVASPCGTQDLPLVVSQKNQLWSCLTRMSGSSGLILAKKVSALRKSVFQHWYWGTSICFSDSLTTFTMDKATTRVSKVEQAENLPCSVCAEVDDFQVWQCGVGTSKLSFDQMVGD